MQKILLLSLCLLVFIFLALTWYLRSSIYWDLGKARVYQPSDFSHYTIGSPTLPELTYVAIGDSLTSGVGVVSYMESYPYLLAEMIAGDTLQVSLEPFAVPGVRSSYVLNNFMHQVIEHKPDVVTLFIGTNDIHGNVSLKKFEEHYAEILAQLTQETEAEVYAINLPYIGTADLISFPYRYYFNWKTEQYNAIIKKLAFKYNVTYIDLYSAHEPYALQNSHYSADSFHPNVVGYTLWSQVIYAGFNQ